MALRKRELDPSIPGTTQVTRCRREVGDRKCNAEAHNMLKVPVEIMGKVVNTQIPFCDKHMEEMTGGSDASS